MARFAIRFGLGILVALVLAVSAVYVLSTRRMNTTWEVPVAAVDIRSDSATLAHGERVARVRGCADCHGEDLGGMQFADEMPVMRVTAPNLTSGSNGIGRDYAPDDWVRAIRSGVDPDGKPLVFMPSHEYRPLGPRDLGALISWIVSLPDVDSEPAEQVVGPLGRVLFLAGQLPLLAAEVIDHGDATFRQPEPGVTVEYGAYMASSCVGCHGDGYSGGPIPGVPPDWPEAANLTPDTSTGLGSWSFEDFVAFVSTGSRPDGTAVDPIMPIAALQAMTDVERDATWLFLQSLPPRTAGGR